MSTENGISTSEILLAIIIVIRVSCRDSVCVLSRVNIKGLHKYHHVVRDSFFKGVIRFHVN